MASNDYLLAVSLLERAVDALKVDSRVQLGRSTLQVCKSCSEMCATKLTNVNFDDTYTLGYIIDSIELMNMLLNNPAFIETDTETKELLFKNLSQSLESLYVKAGKYYATHDFDYNVRLDALLCRIVDKCILSGYFFGVEKELDC